MPVFDTLRDKQIFGFSAGDSAGGAETQAVFQFMFMKHIYETLPSQTSPAAADLSMQEEAKETHSESDPRWVCVYVCVH